MQEVKAAATTGYLLALDQCPGCGGIWTDRWEVFPLSLTAVERLDSVDTAALQAPHAAAAVTPAFECPRCRARLKEFNDPTLPSDARIERCLNCDGMWFNRGELRRFKSRGGRRHAPVNAAAVDRLAAAASGTPTLPTVDHLADVMRASAADAPDDLRGELRAAAIWLAVRTVLRLLFRI